MGHRFDLLAPLHKEEELRFIKAQGAVYVTAEGKEYVDFNEMRVVLGQNNRDFRQGIQAALEGISSQKNSSFPAKEKLLSYLDNSTEHWFRAAFLAASGSEAVEWAVRLAKRITQREEILSFSNSIHGRTYLAASLSGLPVRKVGYGPLSPGIVHLPYPNCAHCPVYKQKGSCDFACLELAKSLYTCASAQRAAAVIVEPYQGAGVIVPPEGYLTRLQQWAHEEGMLLIVDEIQSGMGRSGWMYLYQKEGLQPDMLLLGKALGNGQHIAALLVKPELEKAVLWAMNGGSGEDAVACQAACQVFEALEEGLLAAIKEKGRLLQTGISSFAAHPAVLECRGVGLAAAIELKNESQCIQLHSYLQSSGYLTGRQKAAVYFKPPYVVSEEQVKGLLQAIEKGLKEIS